jgi:hypothetical protein
MAAISVANYQYFGLIFAFSLLHTSEINQGTEYEYKLFVSHRYTPEIRLLFARVIRSILDASVLRANSFLSKEEFQKID